MEDFQLCDLCEMTRASVDKAQFLAQQKEITLHFAGEAPAWIAGNPERLEELILILIENAVLYSPKGTCIQVRVQMRQNTQAVLSVIDQGPGIPPEEVPLIFQRFFRGQQNAQVPGTGLGLALAEQIVQLHKGEITVLPVAEGGSCFQCAFPLQSAS